MPDFELSTEVDAAGLIAATETHGCSALAILVHACATALREHPRANAAYRDGRYELYSRVNVAITVPTADGWTAPTVLDADTRTLPELDAELAELSARATAGELTPPELAGATFTLTDLGPWGVGRPGTFVVPPQAAAIAAGAVEAVPIVAGDAIVPGHRITLTLASDSRILYGVHAAAFLRSVADALRCAGGAGR